MNERRTPNHDPGQGVPAKPEVPVVGDFVVTKVVRLTEDPSERQRIREEYREGPGGRIGLSDTRPGGPPANRGHRRGRGQSTE